MPVFTAPLRSFATGARVTKPSAIPFDFAYGRTGTVVRESVTDEEVRDKDCLGVVWDGSNRAYEYSPETEFAPAVVAPVS